MGGGAYLQQQPARTSSAPLGVLDPRLSASSGGAAAGEGAEAAQERRSGGSAPGEARSGEEDAGAPEVQGIACCLVLLYGMT